MIKACRDCRFLARDKRCEHPKSTIELLDFLTGKTETHIRSIDSMRTFPGECGKDAVLFEPREV